MNPLLRKCSYHLSRFIVKPLAAPELLIFTLTECCNLKCRTCNIRKEIVKENLEIDVEKICDIIDQARDMKIEIVVLSGGEPFLVEDIFKITEYINKLKMKISVTTNGVYSDQLAERIAYSQIKYLHFSLDGLREHHDEIRGSGVYDRLMRNINLIRQLNPDQSIGFGTVICSKNCNDLFEMTKMADNLKVNVMNFIPYLINNIDPQHSQKGREYNELWPDDQDLINLKNNFEKISSYHYKHLKLNLNPDFNLLMDYYSLRKIRKKCFAGYKTIIITAPRKYNDKVVSDVLFCQGSCGNIYDIRLKQAWNSPKAKKMRLIARMCNNPCLQYCHHI
jgi:MoaA/NifB/PqqE/SkfB family radical SAM enzyme